MGTFDLWTESFILGAIYTTIIAVPCILIVIVGRKMIWQLGHFPSKAPFIQMSIFWKLVAIEVVTITLLLAFYSFFDSP